MKNFVNRTVLKLYPQINLMLGGAMLLGVFQVPFLPDYILPAARQEAPISVVTEVPLTEEFFGQEAKKKATVEFIDQKIEFVSTRRAFPASLAVIKKHEQTIKTIAREKGVPEDVAIGISLLENGGSETAVSPAGALGVFQLMPGTARSLGLTVTKKHDDRKNPYKNIEAGITYIKANYDRFGDWGLSTWAYHAGEGNVSKALKLYAKANHGVELKGLKDQAAMRSYVKQHNITIHKLLSSPAVKTLTKKLNDDSAGYPYKVIATATLFKDGSKSKASPSASLIPGLIVENK